jgi:hypothetical protein
MKILQSREDTELFPISLSSDEHNLDMTPYSKHGPSFGLIMCMAIWLCGSVRALNHFRNRCLSFMPEIYIENSTRQVLEYVQAEVNLAFPYDDPTCNRPNQVVSTDLCRVALSIQTSARSSITFELWLPAIWSGRFLATGNGGIDGCMYSLTLCSAK